MPAQAKAPIADLVNLQQEMAVISWLMSIVFLKAESTFVGMSSMSAVNDAH